MHEEMSLNKVKHQAEEVEKTRVALKEHNRVLEIL